MDLSELFYRFLENVVLNISLEDFYRSGYLSLVVQGGRATAQTIQGRKAGFLFVCKLLVNYDTGETLKLVPPY